MKSILFAVTILVWAAPSLAQRNLVLSSIDGECSLTVASDRQACKGLIYMVAKNTKRVNFSVPTELGLIVFSGGSDLQPRLGHYILTVDSVLTTRDGKTNRTPARGTCEMLGSDDAMSISLVTCTAESEFGPIKLTLRGRGKNVTLH